MAKRSLAVFRSDVSTREHPAVHMHRGAGHITAALAGQPAHGAGHFGRGSQASQRYFAEQRFTLRLGQAVGHIGLDKARRHRIHGDVARPQLPRQGPREAFHAPFGGGVASNIGLSQLPSSIAASRSR